MKGLGSLNENKIQGIQNKNKEENLVKFDCENHKNGKSGTIGEKYYKKIFCLDNSDLIKTYQELHNTNNYFSDVAFILNSDLDFSSVDLDYKKLNKEYYYKGNTFAPIGSENNYFIANFYGNNHKIIVGDIDYPDKDNVGFFGYIGKGGKVYDLKLEIGNVNGNDYIGGFVGNYDGIIDSSSVIMNNISGNQNVGGFVGWSYDGKIDNSSAIVNNINGKEKVGGFIGNNDNGTIENSSAIANNISGNNYIGGFIGNGKSGTIDNSSAIVNNINGNQNVGGFIGKNDNGKILNSLAVIDFINGNEYIGGFVGWNYDGIIDSSSAIVNNISGNNYIGGFIGNNHIYKINNSVSKVLTKSDKINNGYYYNENLTEKPKDFYITPKEQIFFGNKNNKGLKYDGNKLYITSSINTEYNETNYSNYNAKIISMLDNFWKKW